MKTEEEVVKKMRDDLKWKHNREREIQEKIIEGLVRPLIRQGLVDDVLPGGDDDQR
jgi:predicted small metal-binding protein